MQDGQEGSRAQLRETDELGPVGCRERDGGAGLNRRPTGSGPKMDGDQAGLEGDRAGCEAGVIDRAGQGL